MNSDQHRRIADFLDNFDRLIKDVVGYASEGQYCFMRTDYTNAERNAIVTGLRERLLHEQAMVEYHENPREAALLQKLFELVVGAMEPR